MKVISYLILEATPRPATDMVLTYIYILVVKRDTNTIYRDRDQKCHDRDGIVRTENVVIILELRDCAHHGIVALHSGTIFWFLVAMMREEAKVSMNRLSALCEAGIMVREHAGWSPATNRTACVKSLKRWCWW